MRDWAIWYRNLFIVWLVLGLPSLVIGYGMSGGQFELPNDLAGALQFSLALAFYAAPAFLWPVRKHGKASGFD